MACRAEYLYQISLNIIIIISTHQGLDVQAIRAVWEDCSDQEDQWLWGAELGDRAQLMMVTGQLCLLEDCRIFPSWLRISHRMIENKALSLENRKTNPE